MQSETGTAHRNLCDLVQLNVMWLALNRLHLTLNDDTEKGKSVCEKGLRSLLTAEC